MRDADTADPPPNGAAEFLALYDRALPQIYGYLYARAGQRQLAEDLTAETFLAAADAIHRSADSDITIGWLMTVARNKLVDHWRRSEREQRGLRLVHDSDTDIDDPDLLASFRQATAHAVLDQLGAHHRSALVLRYLDGLPVPEVAAVLGRTVHATEALLVRARNTFRTVYGEIEGDDHG